MINSEFKRRRGETKSQMIARVNATRAQRRANEPGVDIITGVALLAAGFVIGPPIMGIITGGPLVALGMWGRMRGGYPERTTGRRRWANKFGEDMQALDNGCLPPNSCHHPSVRQSLHNRGYRETDEER